MEDKDIEDEKAVIINEEKQNYNNPGSYLWRIANEGIWNGTRLSNDVYGSKKTISGINKKVVKAFYSKRFTQNNTTLVFLTPILNFSPYIKIIEKNLALQVSKLPCAKSTGGYRLNSLSCLRSLSLPCFLM